MAKSKQAKTATPATWRRVREAFMETDKHGQGERPPLDRELRALARRFGLPSVEVEREEYLGAWNLEREAREAETYLDHFDCKERESVEDLAEELSLTHYRHLLRSGPIGYRVGLAHGREIALRILPKLLRWKAHCEVRDAGKAFDDAGGMAMLR
jgi:hypothetical protein